MKKLNILITILPTICIPLISTTSCNKQEDKINPFCTDSWETICSYINEGGIEKLCEVYNCSPNDFVGLTRIVKLNGFDHKVMVVGVNQDYTEYNPVSGEFSNPVTLTFQFTNLITQEDVQLGDPQPGNYLKSFWSLFSPCPPFDDPRVCNSNYWSGELSSFISNNVYEMIKNGGNDNLHENIKSVYHSINIASQRGSDWHTQPTQTKLFPLNLSNIFSKIGMEKTNKEIMPSDKVSLYQAEGEQYLYYKDRNRIGDNYIVDDNWNWNFFDCLKFQDCKGKGNFGDDSIGIWLASPYVLDTNSVWRFAKDGRMSFDGSGTQHAILPCFCV